MIKNKKGIGGLLISLVFTFIILFILIYVASSINFVATKAKNNIYNAQRIDLSVNKEILKFLNLPTIYNNKEITNKELLLIDLYDYDKNENDDIFKNLGMSTFLSDINSASAILISKNIEGIYDTIYYDTNEKFSHLFYGKFVAQSLSFNQYDAGINIRELFSMNLSIADNLYKIHYLEAYSK